MLRWDCSGAGKQDGALVSLTAHLLSPCSSINQPEPLELFPSWLCTKAATAPSAESLQGVAGPVSHRHWTEVLLYKAASDVQN